MTHEIYPGKNAPRLLLEELSTLLGAMADIERICVFGSLAREDWDRWSDVDVLAVTKSKAVDARVLCHRLQQVKSVLFRGPYADKLTPAGSCVLGMTFADASMFNVLDLNCMTAEEYECTGNIERFGTISELLGTTRPHGSSQDVWPVAPSPQDFAMTPEEFRFNEALFFTMKAMQKFLRREGEWGAVRQCADVLQSALAKGAPAKRDLVGDMASLAKHYLQAVQQLAESREIQ